MDQIEYSCQHAAERYVINPAPMIPVAPDGTVLWSMMNWGDELEKYEQIEIFRQVFEFYSYELWPIRFLSTSDGRRAYFRIAYVREDGSVHLQDGSSFQCPFSFQENPDAIAVFHSNTGGKWSGWGFLNERYYFDRAHGPGRTDLYRVLLHELGHGLGLMHTHAAGDIMLPVYDPENTFTGDSRAGLEQIFGDTRRSLLRATRSADRLLTIPPRPRRCFLHKLMVN